VIKYTPKELTENVNVPKQSALRELFVLLGAVVGIILVVYLVLGLLVDVVVGRLSPATAQKLESKLSPMFLALFTNDTRLVTAETELQGILDQLLQSSGQTQRTFQVHLVKNSNVNAVAIPGGHIVVFSGLVAEAKSENELAMVLGHEVGHFAHRDQLRAMGRGLVLLALSTVLLGGDDAVSGLLQRTLAQAQLKFSRKQELAADEWGLDLIAKRYGHVTGSLDFFRRLGEREKLPQWTAFLMTHPAPAKRVKELEATVRAKSYASGEPKPLPPALREIASPGGP